jgi:hypothetical protein
MPGVGWDRPYTQLRRGLASLKSAPVVSQEWLAEKREMKSAADVSQPLRRLDGKAAMKKVPQERKHVLEEKLMPPTHDRPACVNVVHPTPFLIGDLCAGEGMPHAFWPGSLAAGFQQVGTLSPPREGGFAHGEAGLQAAEDDGVGAVKLSRQPVAHETVEPFPSPRTA